MNREEHNLIIVISRVLGDAQRVLGDL